MQRPYQPPEVQFANIPDSLKKRKQWCLWAHQYDSNTKRWTKIPYNEETLSRCQGDHENWCSPFEVVSEAYKKDQQRDRPMFAGIGFVLLPTDTIVGLDFDNCMTADGMLDRWVARSLEHLHSYSEYSPSGVGIRVFAEGTLPAGLRKFTSLSFEMYEEKRFLTVTGNRLPNSSTDVEYLTPEIAHIHECASLIQQALKNPKFARLWDGDKGDYPGSDGNPDDSAAEAGFCGILAKMCNVDRELIDEVYRMSVLYRRKWDQGGFGDKQDRTYGEHTLDFVLVGYENTQELTIDADEIQCILNTMQGERTAKDAAQFLIDDEESLDLVSRLSKVDYPKFKAKARLYAGQHYSSIDALVKIARESRELESETDNSHRPKIYCTLTAINPPVDDSISTLVRNNHPPKLFIVENRIVQVYIDQLYHPVIDPVSENTLRCILNEHANYVVVGSDGKTKLTFPPMDIVRAVLDDIRLKQQLPLLLDVVSTPVIKPDGSILDRTGYDAETKIMYLPDPTMEIPRVPEHPTEAHLRKSLDTIHHVIGQIPFEGGCDVSYYAGVDDLLAVPILQRNSKYYSMALAMLITPFIRHIVDLIPGEVIDAPERGTGKSLLGEVLTMVVTGRRAAMETAPPCGDDAEWRKKITTILLEHSPIAIFDNISESFDSSSLSALLTATTWKDRALGSNKSVEVPNTTQWIFTGNNVQLGDDLVRKMVMIRLDAGVPEPWLRSEKSFVEKELLQWVHDHRGEIIASILCIIRYWYSRGCPTYNNYTVLGSYEKWCSVVGNILNCAGFDTILTGVREQYEERNDSTSEWGVFLTFLDDGMVFDTLGAHTITVKEVSAHVMSCPGRDEYVPSELIEALEGGTSFTLKLGKAMAKQLNRTFRCPGGGTIQLKPAKNASNGAKRYRLVRQGKSSLSLVHVEEATKAVNGASSKIITLDFSQVS